MRIITTTNFSKFGYRERKMAEQLLHAWNEQGLPEGFSNEEVTIIMNTCSGYVFLTNTEFQVAMMNNGTLDIFYTDPETGEEGFKGELSQETLERLGLVNVSEIVSASSLIDGKILDHWSRKKIEYLLMAWNEDSLPEKFSKEGIRIAQNGDYIFLTNAENQIANLDGYDVKICHTNHETGEEFFEE